MNIAAKEYMSPHLLATFVTTGKIYLAAAITGDQYNLGGGKRLQKMECNAIYDYQKTTITGEHRKGGLCLFLS